MQRKSTVLVRTLSLVSMVVVAAAIFAAFTIPAMSQSRTSTLAGVVLGLDNKPVANASITYQSGGGNAPHATHTDATGHFSVPKLRADIYDVRASSKGIFSDWQKNVSLRPGQTKSVTLRLIYAAEPSKAAVPAQP
jgi:hypothetical protein